MTLAAELLRTVWASFAVYIAAALVFPELPWAPLAVSAVALALASCLLAVRHKDKPKEN